MRQKWSPEELLANWTLVDGDWDLVANKSLSGLGSQVGRLNCRRGLRVERKSLLAVGEHLIADQNH